MLKRLNTQINETTNQILPDQNVIPTNKKLLFWNVGDKCNKAENHVCDLKKINFVIGIS